MAGDGTITWSELWIETTARLGGDRREARWICEEASGASGAEWIAEVDLQGWISGRGRAGIHFR